MTLIHYFCLIFDYLVYDLEHKVFFVVGGCLEVRVFVNQPVSRCSDQYFLPRILVSSHSFPFHRLTLIYNVRARVDRSLLTSVLNAVNFFIFKPFSSTSYYRLFFSILLD